MQHQCVFCRENKSAARNVEVASGTFCSCLYIIYNCMPENEAGLLDYILSSTMVMSASMEFL